MVEGAQRLISHLNDDQVMIGLISGMSEIVVNCLQSQQFHSLIYHTAVDLLKISCKWWRACFNIISHVLHVVDKTVDCCDMKRNFIADQMDDIVSI